jgi:hypothetical protein
MAHKWVLQMIALLLNRRLSYKYEIILVGSHANKKSLGLYVKDGEVVFFPFQQYRAAGRFEVEKKEFLGCIQIAEDNDALKKLARDIAREAQSLNALDSALQLFQSYESKHRPPPGAKVTNINLYILTSHSTNPFTDSSRSEQISLGVLRLFEKQIPRCYDCQCILKP